MATLGFRFRRDIWALKRRTREWRMIFKGVLATDHPVMAAIADLM